VRYVLGSDPKVTVTNFDKLTYAGNLASLADVQANWRHVVATAATVGVPMPAFMSALAYYDGYRHARLPANLLQAQRDYFGAHTYQRTDKPGTFHAEWLDLRRPV
jgi:6-phosphogluconate dehydrogenase